VNEDAIRAIVRDTLARLDSSGRGGGQAASAAAQPLTFAAHPSHHRYGTLPSSGGPCLIEPGVACNHCGYCQSHGH
jgi:hypothetical protein